MNTLTNILRYTTIVVLCIGVLSCKKDGEKDEIFDINKLSDYILFARRDDGNPKNSIRLYDFKAGNEAMMFTGGGNFNAQQVYTIVDNNTIMISNTSKIVFDQQGNVTSMIYNNPDNPEVAQTYKQFKLIKKHTTDQLAGKSFRFRYYNPDGSLVPPEHTYTFAANGSKPEGQTINGALRNSDYTLIGNVAYVGSANKGGTTDYEVLVLVNGKLEASYRDNTESVYLYGSFEELK